METAVKLLVEGNVQGVGFRALVKQIAKKMKLKGYVKNLEDGSVEIVCQGEKSLMENFKKSLLIKPTKKGPLTLDVDTISETEIKIQDSFKAFNIDYGDEASTPFEKTNLERLEIGSLILTDFRDSVSSKFDKLDEKYGEISGHMVKMEENIADAVLKMEKGQKEISIHMSNITDELTKSNQNNAILIKSLSEKLDRVIK